MRAALVIAAAASVSALALAACGGGSSGSASSAGGSSAGGEIQPMRLRLATDVPETASAGLADKYFIDQVSKLTGGKIKISFYPASQLGTEQAEVTGVKTGAIDIVDLPASEIATIFPKLAVFNLPFLIPSVAGAKALFESPIGKDALKSMSSSVIGLGYWTNGAADLLTKSAVQTPADLKGKRIRATTDETVTAIIKSFGASPVPIPATQVYSGLQQNVLQGSWGTVGGFYGLKWYEHAKNYIALHPSWDVEVLLMSKTAWARMSDAARAAITKAMKAAEKFNVGKDEQIYNETVDQMRKGGVKVITPDRAPFRQLTDKIRNQFNAKLGQQTVDQAFAVEKPFN